MTQSAQSRTAARIMLEDIPPHDDSTERALLNCALADESTIELALARGITHEAFYQQAHRLIWKSILAQREVGPVNIVTVTDRLREERNLDSAGGASYVTLLLSEVPTPANWQYYTKRLLALARRREIVKYGVEAVRVAQNVDAGSPEAVEARLGELAERLPKPIIDSPTYIETSYNNRIVTAADLLASPESDQLWWPLWGQSGLIGPGIATLMSGHSKIAGKSTSVSIGLRDLSRSNPDVRILWLSEEPRSIWRKRFGIWGAMPWKLLFADGTPWSVVLREIEREDAHIVVVDTLRSFAGIVDENDAAKVVAAVQPLVLITRRGNVGVIALHHLRKSEGEEGLAHAGNTALVALMDVALELRRDQHSSVRRIVHAVSRFDETPRALALELRDGNIVSLGPPEAVALEEVAERIWAILPAVPAEALKPAEIRARLDEPQPSAEQIGRALHLLEATNKADCFGKGVRGDPQRWYRP
jgi:DnaB helicase-like protein/AAA domain-containing protein